MLSAEHIKVLRIDRVRMEAHARLPPPSYSMKTATTQLAAISDAAVSSLLNLDIDTFIAQLPRARRYNVSCVFDTSDHGVVGISAATSMIRGGAVANKHLIIPHPGLRNSNGLDKHFVIGLFIRGIVVDNYLPSISKVEVAGWLDTDTLDEVKVNDNELPQRFQSKLSVVMVPCVKLNPIDTLEAEVLRCIKGEGRIPAKGAE